MFFGERIFFPNFLKNYEKNIGGIVKIFLSYIRFELEITTITPLNYLGAITAADKIILKTVLAKQELIYANAGSL